MARQNRNKCNKKTRRSKSTGGAALQPAEFNHSTEMNEAQVTGGSGAAEYAIGVYGGIDSQHPVAGSNVIAMNNPTLQVTDVVGGKKGGHGILTDVAVPALLLYANTTFKRNRSANKPRKSLRKSVRSKRGKSARRKR
jgi:hypothetical protein